MTWWDHTWEFAVSVFSWIIAIGALAVVAIFFVVEAVKNRGKGQR